MSEPALSAPDVLGGPSPARRLARLSGGTVLPAVIAVAAASVATAGVAVLAFLSGGGTQPEDVLPAGAIAFLKVDLDPAANQKVAVYRLAEKFPASADVVDDEDDVRDQLLGALFEDVEGVDYAADIAPWLGDRAAIAALPSGGEVPDALAAVAYRDRAAAEAGLARLKAADESVVYAFSEKGDYVLLGDSQAVVDAAVEPPSVLGDAASYTEAVDALDGDQIMTGWVDLAAFWGALPPAEREEASRTLGAAGDLSPTGQAVFGARADDRFIEVQGRTLDATADVLRDVEVGGQQVSGMVRELPASTVLALSVSGLGDGLATLYERTAGGPADTQVLRDVAEQAGLSLPQDLRVLLGDETMLGVFGAEDIAVRSRGDDGDAYAVAERIAQSISDSGGPPAADTLRRAEAGVAVGTTPAALDQITASGGGLGDSARFQLAVPDAEDAGMVLYLDVARALELGGPGGDVVDRSTVEPLEAVGLTAEGGDDAGFRLRFTVR